VYGLESGRSPCGVDSSQESETTPGEHSKVRVTTTDQGGMARTLKLQHEHAQDSPAGEVKACFKKRDTDSDFLVY
jgi:hypothetical protein